MQGRLFQLTSSQACEGRGRQHISFQMICYMISGVEAEVKEKTKSVAYYMESDGQWFLEKGARWRRECCSRLRPNHSRCSWLWRCLWTRTMYTANSTGNLWVSQLERLGSGSEDYFSNTYDLQTCRGYLSMLHSGKFVTAPKRVKSAAVWLSAIARRRRDMVGKEYWYLHLGLGSPVTFQDRW